VTAIALDAWNAGRWGDGGNSISTRVDAIMEFLDPTLNITMATSNVSAMNVAGQDMNGKSALALINEIADAERGSVYVDASGNPKFRGSTARTAASILTLDSLADLDGSQDLQLITDDSLFANRIVASGPAGSFTVEDAASIAQIGIVSEAWNCVAWSLSTPATNRLNARLNDEPRIGAVTIDLMTCNVSKTSCLALVPLDRVTLTNLPTQLGSSSREVIIEGLALQASTSQYSLTLELSPTG
jgi:hypothetical protein